jgi:hypothetical protein
MAPTMPAGNENASFAMPFDTKTDNFTKTGSGQTQEKVRKERCVFSYSGAFKTPGGKDFHAEDCFDVGALGAKTRNI